ncbi:hypothetical protein [Phyllobacterium sp. DC2300-2]|jgi:hypothetical protein|uniref:hypothetical protein n=1 Tax=Phyllobacterium sp. DC2300-2 TaxID=2804618 RepID=UPI001AC658DB|nr:hypothetical protein [Phyllobacterium sp.]
MFDNVVPTLTVFSSPRISGLSDLMVNGHLLKNKYVESMAKTQTRKADSRHGQRVVNSTIKTFWRENPPFLGLTHARFVNAEYATGTIANGLLSFRSPKLSLMIRV